MQICFFEDKAASNFLPLTLTRPLDNLRIGILTISEKWLFFFKGSSIRRIQRPFLKEVFESEGTDTSKDCLWINSRFLPDYALSKSISALDLDTLLVDGDTIVAAKLNGADSSSMLKNNSWDFSSYKTVPLSTEATSITYLWDLLALNGNEIQKDLQHLSLKTLPQSKYAGYCMSLNAENIFIADSAKVEPGCTIIAENGPVYIGPNATIEAGAILRGPVAICEGATVKMSGRIYDGTTIGPVCKVGGEVANTIFHSYSNKAHDGFVGNSLIGQWVNLGADTNTSNLKNNYSAVKITNWESKEPNEEGVQFFGSVIADHTKTAINTMLNTGTVCGVCSNIFQAGFPPKHIPSFSWMDGKETQVYDFDKALEAMSAMMKRRGIELPEGYRTMMKHIFDEEHAV